MTPEELRTEADVSEAAALKLPDGAQREWLLAKAEALRHEAARMEQRIDLRPDLLSPGHDSDPA